MFQLQVLLTASSRDMFSVTGGRVTVRDITILLPNSWLPCAPASALVAATRTPADVIVTPSHPLLGDTPWAVQFAGCRQQGKNIQLPIAFINKNKTIHEKGSLFAKEWVKMRFGVFEEDGFEGDSLYPSSFVEGKRNVTNSGCDSHEEVCSLEDDDWHTMLKIGRIIADCQNTEPAKKRGQITGIM